MAVGRYKDITKEDIQSILAGLYERRHIDGYLQPFYSQFYENQKELIIICHHIFKFNAEEPEYHLGDLEIAYRQLKELFEVDEDLTQLRDFEQESLKFKRSTK